MTRPTPPLEPVSELLRELADELVVPRFRSLSAGDVTEKGLGDLVTIVDREVEERLARELPLLLPGSRLVAEEAASVDPSLLLRLDAGRVWLVDPLDGTSNFVTEDPSFAVMIGLLQDGDPVAGWIYAPMTGSLAVAEAGAGTRVDGRPLRLGPDEGTDGKRHPEHMASTQYLPEHLSDLWEAAGLSDRFDSGSGSAGVEYPALLTRRWSSLLYWRTLPWDHAAGSLLVREAGGHVARLDGSPYSVTDGSTGLLVASSEAEWARVRDMLPPAIVAGSTGRPPKERP